MVICIGTKRINQNIDVAENQSRPSKRSSRSALSLRSTPGSDAAPVPGIREGTCRPHRPLQGSAQSEFQPLFNEGRERHAAPFSFLSGPLQEAFFQADGRSHMSEHTH